MACKSWQATNYQRRSFPTFGPYSGGAGTTFTLGGEWNVRGQFLVNNDPGALDCTGELRFEQFRDNAWKLAQVNGLQEFKFATSSTWYETSFKPSAIGYHKTRFNLLYAGEFGSDASFWYPSIVKTWTVVGPTGEFGELTEFFEDDDFGVTAWINGLQFPGIFDEPYRRAMQMEGAEPSLVVETALAGVVEHGEGVTLDEHPGRAWIVRGLRKQDDQTTRVMLEEVL